MSHDNDLDLVTVLATNDLGLIDIAEGLLDGAGIPYLAKGAGVQDLFGLGRLTGHPHRPATRDRRKRRPCIRPS